MELLSVVVGVEDNSYKYKCNKIYNLPPCADNTSEILVASNEVDKYKLPRYKVSVNMFHNSLNTLN